MTVATQQDITDQQRRVIVNTKNTVADLLRILIELRGHDDAYTQLGLGDDLILDLDAFVGTGTGAAEYRAAITSVEAFFVVMANGHGTNLRKFAL